MTRCLHIVHAHRSLLQTDFFVVVIITRLKGRVGIEWRLFDFQSILQGKQGSSLRQKPGDKNGSKNH